MRNVLIGIVFGLVVGVAIGNGVIAPRLQTPATAAKPSLLLPAAVPAVAIPAATASAPRLTAEAAPAVPNQPGPRPLAAIEWRMEGEHLGNGFQIRGSEHYGFRENLIAEIRQYWTFDPQSPGGGLIDYPYNQPTRLGSDDSQQR